MLYGYTGCPGWDGTEQDGAVTGSGTATRPTWAATATREGQQVCMLLFFVIVSLLSSFLLFTILLFQ